MNHSENPPDQNAAKAPPAVGGSTPPAATPPVSGSGGGQPAASSGGMRRVVLIIIAVLILIGALALGFFPRWHQRQTAEASTVELAIPTVDVKYPKYDAPTNGLMLPAEIRPWREASIYARVNGYLKDWQVDIGAHVKQNQQ